MNFRIILLFYLSTFFISQVHAMQNKAGRQDSFAGFDEGWDKVAAFEKVGQTKSALKEVEILLAEARRLKDEAQYIKALLHRFKYRTVLEEDSELLVVQELEAETGKAFSPASAAVLHSILAEAYTQYFQANSYRILNRTTLAGDAGEDFRTWDLRTLMDQIRRQYALSVQPEAVLQEIPVNRFDPILVKAEEAAGFRPTLFDLLAHRALDFFINSSSWLSEPVTPFELNDPAYFGPAESFVSLDIPAADAAHRDALALFAELLDFRLKAGNAEALLDADLKRFDFLKQYSRNPEAQALYREGLENQAGTYPQSPHAGYVLYRLARHFFDESPAERPQTTDSPNLRKQAEVLCERIVSEYPGTLGAGNAEALLGQIRRPELRIQSETAWVPGKSTKIQVGYTNLSQVWFRLVAVDWAEVHERAWDYRDREAFMAELLRRKPVSTWSSTVTDPGDRYGHSTEIRMDAPEPGFYFLFAADSPEFDGLVSFAENLWSSDISLATRRDANGNLEVYVSDRTSGLPLAGASVLPYYREYDYNSRRHVRKPLPPLTADARGFALVRLPEGLRNARVQLEVNHARQVFTTEREFHLYPAPTPEPRWRNQTWLFTDRALYRPGQPIYFKGILTETNGEDSRILAHTTTQVTFRDVNYREIGKLTLRTNDFGSFHGVFTAPASGLMGSMTIQGDGGQTAVQVEEYKRPTFEVLLDSLTASYSLGEDVTVNGRATTYAGAPVSYAEVRYRVVRQVRWRWWGWWGFRRPSAGESREIAHGTVKSGADGRFSLSFTAHPDLAVARKDDPRFEFVVTTDVVDRSGETRSAQKTVTLAWTGLDLELEYPEQVDRERPGSLALVARNLDGQAVEAEAEVVLYRLLTEDRLLRERYWEAPDMPQWTEEEHRRLFPDDVYLDKSPEELPRTEVARFRVRTGADTRVELPPLAESGQYLVEAECLDRAGNRITGKAVFTATSNADRSPAVPVALSLESDSAVYRPGATAGIRVATSLDDAFVRVLVTHNGNVLVQRDLQLSNETAVMDVPVTEALRGGIRAVAMLTHRNRIYTRELSLDVPFPDRDLQVSWETFRDQMRPGEQQEWKLTLKGPGGDPAAIELLATLYDKSLDQFLPHAFRFNPAYRPALAQASVFDDSGNFQAVTGRYLNGQFDYTGNSYRTLSYDALNLFGFYLPERNGRFGALNFAVRSDMAYKTAEGAAPEAAPNMVEEAAMDEVQALQEPAGPEPSEVQPPLRTNLQETAFFHPQLATNEQGEIVIRFTAPEALTTWKFLGMAHDRDLRYRLFSKEVKTQQEVMITPHLPRFIREGDDAVLTARIDNLTDGDLETRVSLVMRDLVSGEDITAKLLRGTDAPASVGANGSASASWRIAVPEGLSGVTFEFRVMTGSFADGVSVMLPVLTNRMLVTESLPLWLPGPGSRSFVLESLRDNTSETLRHHQYTLEYTANPAWYAVQALPYLMEFPHECSEQLFSRYYANALAAHIAHSNPAIRRVFEQWRATDAESLLSNLEKNQDLKALLIEETPWLRDAQDESERKRRIALLFDLNRVAGERQAILDRLLEMQSPNGGFPWFAGMPDNRYITQHILTGLAHLQQLGVNHGDRDDAVRLIMERALAYLDARVAEDLEQIKRHDKNWKDNNHLNALHIQYLYVRGHFREYLPAEGAGEAFRYFLDQGEKFWMDRRPYEQAMLAIALHRLARTEPARQIVVMLRENAIVSEEKGMYWKAVESGGYFWYNAPIEAQAMLIEAFHTVADDAEAVNGMKWWLLRQKQVQDWKTTKATAEAVFALLLRGDDWLGETVEPEIKVGGKTVDVRGMDASYEAGTGYFKVNWSGGDIESGMAGVEVSSSSEAPSWGAVYWQYFEDLDNIAAFEETPMKLGKELYVERPSDSGPQVVRIDGSTELRPGDLVKVRIELRVDRNMEFVHMKDLRAGGLEPVNVLSRYKYQDGLGYYESTRDAATHFFFDYLPKGVYVFEYPLRVAHRGDYSTGVTTIQSMYAPEFSGHSQGGRIAIAGE